MVGLLEWLKAVKIKERKLLANIVKTDLQYLYSIAHGKRNASEKLATRIEQGIFIVNSHEGYSIEKMGVSAESMLKETSK